MWDEYGAGNYERMRIGCKRQLCVLIARDDRKDYYEPTVEMKGRANVTAAEPLQNQHTLAYCSRL
ncbi:hypothetical protein NECAME_04128 [Necator americanus]|uniref:Uncharacterized protein n=1 Tax=Necator americanus TaxID=51031 RepID=W2SWG1_NECAM|nr:hypothetical protein NECAME_04128 [Necator americanus]ETN74099.1 hypothetical protein NECAME_04128 [Necator americanus]